MPRQRSYYRTFAVDLNGVPRTEKPTIESGWGRLTQAVIDNTVFYWDIIDTAKKCISDIAFEEQALDKEGRPRFKRGKNSVDQLIMRKVPPKIIVNDLRRLMEDQNPYKLHSTVVQATYYDCAENLSSWYFLDKNWKNEPWGQTRIS